MDRKQYEYLGTKQNIYAWAAELDISVSTLRHRMIVHVDNKDKIFRGKVREFKGACVIEGCEKKVKELGVDLCLSHWNRKVKYGGPLRKKRNITNEKEYGVWQNMKLSGEKVDWVSYKSFRRDMGAQPMGKVLCRRDWSLGYVKGNCFWGTRGESRHGTVLEYGGETMSLPEWSRRTGIGVGTLAYRVKVGWPVERVLGV
jgi:hypothetical protein